jgi:cyclase
VLRKRVMPCLLLKKGRLVKTIKFEDPSYVGDPINAIRIYNEKEVDDLVVLDIGATVDGTPIPLALLGRFATECFMPLAYGGGIRTIDDVKQVLAIGAEKVVLNTSAVDNPALVTQASEMFGAQAVVVSIDVRKRMFGRYEVFTSGGKRKTGLDPVQHALAMQAAGAGELFVTSIDRDGTMSGYEVELIRRITGAVSIPVIACGGAGKLEHIAEVVRDGGASAAAAGSMVVYQGPNRAVLISFPSREELKTALGAAAFHT